MLQFSTVELMDEQKCYDFLIGILHPNGLCCGKCQRPVAAAKVHRHERAPVLFYRCACGCIYNGFAGTVGRESGEVRLEVKHGSSRAELQPHVEAYSKPGATVNTDEWQGYNRVEESGRVRKSVCHQPGKRVWAKDMDGDGINEVHTNT